MDNWIKDFCHDPYKRSAKENYNITKQILSLVPLHEKFEECSLIFPKVLWNSRRSQDVTNKHQYRFIYII